MIAALVSFGAWIICAEIDLLTRKIETNKSKVKQWNFLPGLRLLAHHNMYRDVEARIEKLKSLTHRTQFNFISIQNIEGVEKLVFYSGVECASRHLYAV